MTLTEFLLARVAEDEAPTFEIVPYDCEPGCCAPSGYVGHRCLICDGAASYGGTVEAITEIAEEHAEQIHRRSRVLAECAAKREIVETCRPRYLIFYRESEFLLSSAFNQEHMKVEAGSDAIWPFVGAEVILQSLALPYADHPNYREEWKP